MYIVLKDTTLLTKMSKILDYKHFMKVDKLKCEQ